MIIEELDKEGINLQETILNLENQGYQDVWNDYVEYIWNRAIAQVTCEFAIESLKKEGLRRKFDKQLKNKLWGDSFWSDSYCLITTGQTTLDQVKKYVEGQGEQKNVSPQI